MAIPKLNIKVVDGEVTEVRFEAEQGTTSWLSEGSDYVVYYEQRRTERCRVCDQLYTKSEIVGRDGIKLCQSCDYDRYPIRDEDIPY